MRALKIFFLLHTVQRQRAKVKHPTRRAPLLAKEARNGAPAEADGPAERLHRPEPNSFPCWGIPRY